MSSSSEVEALILRQLVEFRKELQSEKECRSQIEDELQKVLNQVNTLKHELEMEKKKRATLTAWIKENLGNDMEVIKEYIDKRVTSRPRKASHGNSLLDAKPVADFNLDGNTATDDIFNIRKNSDNPTETQAPQEELKIVTRVPATNPTLDKIELSILGGVNFNPQNNLPVNDATTKVNNPVRIQLLLVTKGHAKDKYSCNNLHLKVEQFIQRGGNFLIVPESSEDLKKDRFIFGIKSSDELFPMCTDGLHRSQLLYIALRGIKRKLGKDKGVNSPHGALSGFDPFVLVDHPKDFMQQYRFLDEYTADQKDGRGVISKTFKATFGEDRAPRFGQDKVGPSPDITLLGRTFSTELAQTACIKTRETMREYFDLYYYRAKSTKNRMIYMAFGSAVPILIDRLLEVNGSPGSLSNVYILALPFGVKPFASNEISKNSLMDLYRGYASLFVPVID